MNEKMSNSGFDLNFHDDLCDEHFSHTCLSFVYFILKNVPYPLIIDFSGFLFSYCNSLHMTDINSLSHSYKTVLFSILQAVCILADCLVCVQNQHFSLM